jgi:hypothetical protein
MIGNERGTDTRDLIGAHSDTDAAAADGHTAIHAAPGNRVRERNDEVGIIVFRIHGEGPKVPYFVSGGSKPTRHLFFQVDTAMIGCDSNTHFTS